MREGVAERGGDLQERLVDDGLDQEDEQLAQDRLHGAVDLAARVVL